MLTEQADEESWSHKQADPCHTWLDMRISSIKKGKERINILKSSVLDDL